MDALQVALLNTASSISVFVLTLIAILSKRRLDITYLLPIIGIAISIVHHVIFAVAKTIWLLYLGLKFFNRHKYPIDALFFSFELV
jgi:hypothetical protein